MPANKNALLRYRTIDRCLRNRQKRWTLEDLIEECSKALCEYSGKSDTVSKRTIQLDIQKMRSEELGYCAPIIVKENRYYEYEDPDYTITDIPLTEHEISLMDSAVSILRQLQGFTILEGLEDAVGRLEDKIGVSKKEHIPAIFYEKNDMLKGLCHIPRLFSAINLKKPILITYKSFKATKDKCIRFSPYCLKEYRNRWFVFGRMNGRGDIINLALDRIISIEDAPEKIKFIPARDFRPESWFADMVGVTREKESQKEIVKFFADAKNVPYIETKPLHKSQKIVERREDGSVLFQVEVIPNMEFEHELLGFGDGVRIVEPERLRNSISEKMKKAVEQYLS